MVSLWKKKFQSLPDSLKGVIVLMIAALGFTVMTAMIKLLGSRLHVTQILFLRQLGMTLIVAPTLARNFPGSIKTARLHLHLIRISFALVAMLAGFTAIIHLPLADATAIGFAKSFFVTVFAIWILHEIVGIRRWSATIVGFLGVLLMLQPGSQGFSIYGLYAVIAAAAAGVVMVIIRLMVRTEAPATILTYQAVGVGLIMMVPAIIYWQDPSLSDWLIIIAIGAISYFSQTCNIYAFKWGEASLMASLDYVRLIYATGLGFFIFSEIPSVNTWIGAVIIVTAAVYTVHREAKRKKNPTEPK